MSGSTSDAGRFWQGTPGAPAIKNAWGTFLNDNAGIIAQLVTGYGAVNIAGLTTYTLTTSNWTSDQARPAMIDFTGALSGTCTVTLPNVNRWAVVRNSTTGGHDVLLTSGGGTTATIPADSLWRTYWCNGSGDVALPSTDSWQTIATYSPSGAASQEVPLSTSYRRFRVQISSLRSTTSLSSLNMEFSSDGGSTYKTTLYSFADTLLLNDGTSTNYVLASTSAINLLSSNLSSTSSYQLTVDIYPGSATDLPVAYGLGFGVGSSGYGRWTVGGSWNGTAVRMNYAKFYASIGNLSATIILEGLP